MKRSDFLSATGFISVALLASGAHAQAPAQGAASLDEVVVTAQKRTESAQDIPKSVQVVSKAQLADNNITDINDLRKLVPAISGAGLSIRGVASNASTIGGQGKVGITLDDVPQPSRATLANNLLDIDRVEVLPGPQGTLSGRNATGGLINMVTRAPSKTFTATGSGLATSDHERQIGLYASGPISDGAEFSVSAYFRHLRGLVQNVTSGDWVGSEVGGIRGKLALHPTSDLDITLTGFHQQTNALNSGPANNVFSYLSVPTSQVTYGFDMETPRRSLATLQPGITIGPDAYQFASPRASKSRTIDDGGVLRVDYSIGSNTLSSISSYLFERNPLNQDFTGATLVNMNIRPEFDGSAHVLNKTQYYTQEVRLVSAPDTQLRYVAGAFYSNNENTYDYVRYLLPVNWNRQFGQKSIAAFGHLEYDFSKLTVMGGLRYEKDDIDYTWVFNPILATSKTLENGIVLQFPLVNNAAVTAGQSQYDYVNYDAAVQYHLTDDLMAYLNYGKASQGAIYDAEDNTIAVAKPLTPLPPEEVSNWELGAKSQWFSHRLTLNVDLFDGKYRNYQLQTLTQDVTNPNSVPVLKLASVGRVETKGVEVAANALVTDNFRANLAMSYTDAKILDFPYANCYTGQTVAQGCVNMVVPGESAPRNVQLNLAGKPLASAPQWKTTASGTYTIPEVISDLNLFFTGTVRYQSSSNTDLLGNPANALKASTFVNTNIGLQNQRYRLEFFVNNLTKQAVETYGTTLFIGYTLPPGATVRTRNGINRDNTRYWGVRFAATY